LIFDILVKKGTCRAFAFDIKLEDLPHAWRNIVIAIDIAGAELNLHNFVLFVVVDTMNGGGFSCEYRLCHSWK
jgi:hypothetical protein